MNRLALGCFACVLGAAAIGWIFGVGSNASGDEGPARAASAPATGASQPGATTRPDTSDMVLVPAGEFVMGNDDPSAQMASKPAHKVYLRSYYIAKYEVTKEEFCNFLNGAGKMTVEKGNIFDENGKMICRPDLLTTRGGKWVPMEGFAKHPVVSVTWYGADRCARYFGKRLPTDAEWEKAARAGTSTPWFFGDDPSKLDDYAWYIGNADRKTHEVGLKRPNQLGLYDIYGNVYEVVADWYSTDYYAKSPTTQPTGPAQGTYHIRRGGSYYYSAKAGCNSWQRVTTQIGNESEATIIDSNWGFRLAADAPAGTTTRASENRD